MKKILLLLHAATCFIGATAQSDRFVCDVNRDRHITVGDVGQGVNELNQPSSPMTMSLLREVVDGVIHHVAD